jgi:hypothetical protein
LIVCVYMRLMINAVSTIDKLTKQLK